MKLLCRLFGHRWGVWSRWSEKDNVRDCRRCGLFDYRNAR